LRRYHEAGLLEPAHVDRQTGYRYYSVDQVPTAQVIHRFRELGMPVREVGELVAVTDPGARAALIAHHLDRLETQLDQTRASAVALRRLLQPAPAPLKMHRRRTEAATVAAVRDVAGPCVRSTMSGPATPTTVPNGARRSAGRSFRLPARTTAASLLKKSPGACGQAFSPPGTSSPRSTASEGRHASAA